MTYSSTRSSSGREDINNVNGGTGSGRSPSPLDLATGTVWPWARTADTNGGLTTATTRTTTSASLIL